MGHRIENSNANVISLALQIGLPIIVQYRKGSKAVKIVEEISKRSRSKVLGVIDFTKTENTSELTGRYILERTGKPEKREEGPEEVLYVRPKEEDLVAPEWLLNAYRTNGAKTLIIDNLISQNEIATKNGIKLLLGEADRFKMPKTLRVIGMTPKGHGGHLPSVYASTHSVWGEIMGDEFLDIEADDEEMPIVMTSYAAFVGKWRMAISAAIRESPTLLRWEVSVEEALHRPVATINSWETAVRMIAAADSTKSSENVMRAATEACVGKIRDEDWNLLLSKYKEVFAA